MDEEWSEWAQEVTCFICCHFDAAGRTGRIGIGGIEIGLKDNFVFRNRTQFVQENVRFVGLFDDPRCIGMYWTILDRVAMDRRSKARRFRPG